jgi:hypothetical protein
LQGGPEMVPASAEATSTRSCGGPRKEIGHRFNRSQLEGLMTVKLESHDGRSNSLDSE